MAKYLFKSDQDAQVFMDSIVESLNFEKLINKYVYEDILNIEGLESARSLNNYQEKGSSDNFMNIKEHNKEAHM